jgi:hypothetical protein
VYFSIDIDVISDAIPGDSFTVLLWAIENDFTIIMYGGWKK